MKKLLVEYYSRKNLGDDLFIQALSNHFSDCKIVLLGNPLMTSQDFNKNVHFHPISYFLLIIDKLISLLGGQNKAVQSYVKYRAKYIDKLKKKYNAFVKIGGSIFMLDSNGEEEIDFSANSVPCYDLQSVSQDVEPNFIIGANLGPVYFTWYWKHIENTFLKYKHVTLRDYSSYLKVSHLPHVQYAPDVIFTLPVPSLSTDGSVLISVIDVSIHTSDSNIIESYYQQLTTIINHFVDSNTPVTLVSFCEKEGDVKAIQKLLSMVENPAQIKTCYYNGKFNEVIELFAKAKYVVASRFHSVILGVHFQKPVLPIMYSCKTNHYLMDLGFEGIKVKLSDLPNQTLNTLLYNYETNYIVDCQNHKRYAKNQFWALRDYIDSLD